MNHSIKRYWNKNTDAAPLAVFRIFFGAIMVFSMMRFQYYDWIHKLYIEPSFHFKFYGFEWVQALGSYTYLLFLICGVAAFFVMLGWQYRIAIITFFLSFTYIELMDKTNYLNHYYFVSCVAFLLCFLPANACFSLDARAQNKSTLIPRWSIDAIKVMLTIVWFYAGLAKLNSDWLLEAQPLKIWLMAKYDIPILGGPLQKESFHYLFSWFGALYDLSIPFLLWYKKTRSLAFIAVIIFHLLTWILFPIGVFPWVMIGSALIFFDEDTLRKFFKLTNRSTFTPTLARTFFLRKIAPIAVGTFLFFQLLIPFRHLLYPGELFWTEDGFRFSWRVMLMEKAGYANFKVVDSETGQNFYVQNGTFLNPRQEKQMATQPDFIVEFAHYLEKYYQRNGINDPEIYVESYVALNGRSSQQYVDPTIDLTKVSRNFRAHTILLPFEDEIRGF